MMRVSDFIKCHNSDCDKAGIHEVEWLGTKVLYCKAHADKARAIKAALEF